MSLSFRRSLGFARDSLPGDVMRISGQCSDPNLRELGQEHEHSFRLRRRCCRCCAPSTLVRTSFSQGPSWILGTTEGHYVALFTIGALLVLFGTVCWSIVGGNDEYSSSLGDSFWISWGLFFDPGTQTGLPASDPTAVKAIAVTFSVVGFIFNLTLLGTVVEGVKEFLNHCKETYSGVSSTGHVLVLGWGEKTLSLLSELLVDQDEAVALAQGQNLKRHRRLYPRRLLRLLGRGKPRRPKVVILADMPETAMRQKTRIHLHFENIELHDIVFRQGSPTSRTDLMKANAPMANSILIMSKGDTGIKSDQETIQILLSLGALPGAISLAGDVFVEVQSQQTVTVAQTVLPSAEGIVLRYRTNQMLVLRALIPSVGYAYLDLVSFRRGNELYLLSVPPDLLGRPFQDVFLHFPEAVIFGVLPYGGSSTELNMDGKRPLSVADRLVVFAHSLEKAKRRTPAKDVQDAGSLGLLPEGHVPHPSLLEDMVRPDGQLLLGPNVVGPKVVLLIGCPSDFPNVLEALDQYLAAGSEVHCLSKQDEEWRQEMLAQYFGPCKNGEDGPLRRLAVKHYQGEPTDPNALSRLPLVTASCCMILADHRNDFEVETPLTRDSENLTTVITLRALLTQAQGGKKCKVVTELLDPKSQQVVERNDSVRRIGSFVYSNAISTGIFAMASAERAAYNIWKELLDPAGWGNIAAVPAKDWLTKAEELSFHDLHTRVRRRCGGVLLGWRRTDARWPELNPRNKHETRTWNFSDAHELIVLRPSLATTPFTPTESVKALCDEVIGSAVDTIPNDVPVEIGIDVCVSGLLSEGLQQPPVVPGTEDEQCEMQLPGTRASAPNSMLAARHATADGEGAPAAAAASPEAAPEERSASAASLPGVVKDVQL